MDKLEQILRGAGFSARNIADFHKAAADGRHLESANVAIQPVSVFGHLSIDIIKDKVVYPFSAKKNHITNKGWQILANMWGGPDGEWGSGDTYQELKPYRIAVGTAQHANPTSSSLVALNTQLLIKVINQRVFLGTSTNGVRFEMIVEESEGNGSDFKEAGLFPNDFESSTTGAGGMIAYQAYSTISKNSSFQVQYNWSFTFTAA